MEAEIWNICFYIKIPHAVQLDLNPGALWVFDCITFYGLARLTDAKPMKDQSKTCSGIKKCAAFSIIKIISNLIYTYYFF